MDFAELAEEIGISEEEYIDLGRLFLKTSGEDLKKLEAAVKDADFGATARVAHQIKGSSLNLEFRRISAAAESIEKNAKTNSLVGAPESIRAIRSELDSIAQNPDTT